MKYLKQRKQIKTKGKKVFHLFNQGFYYKANKGKQYSQWFQIKQMNTRDSTI